LTAKGFGGTAVSVGDVSLFRFITQYSGKSFSSFDNYAKVRFFDRRNLTQRRGEGEMITLSDIR